MSFIVFELSVYVLAMLCLRHAMQRGRFAVTAVLATGIIRRSENDERYDLASSRAPLCHY